MIKFYGIPNCNTVKKAKEWLENNGRQFEFHDYKKKGITKDKLEGWMKEVDYEKLLNKKGTTWRSLSVEQQQKIVDERSAIDLMIEKPSIIKRPVIEFDGKLLVGFNEDEFKVAFAKG